MNYSPQDFDDMLFDLTPRVPIPWLAIGISCVMWAVIAAGVLAVMWWW